VNYLDSLNPAQRQAVLHREGPLLIVAGAGAGKTKTITHRILHLINTGIAPSNILAITFTNKAAKEMRDRVSALLEAKSQSPEPFVYPQDIEQPFVSTFHSLGVHILRAHPERIGLNKYFSILDRDESLSSVKAAMKQLGFDDKQVEPRKILGLISRQKGNGFSANEYAGQTHHAYTPKIAAAVWQKYEERLRAQKALDFDDLLLKTVELLKKDADLRAHYQTRWQFIHIDEYQDTNTIQYELSRLLAIGHRNLCVVGDIDQSIYGWRGADYTNILDFEKDYPETKVVLLEENYRSTQTILQAANDVIKKNVDRREKNLFTKNKAGEKITVYAGLSESEEATHIARTAQELIRGGANPEEIAVLYRANFQSRALEEGFLREAVAYQVIGVRFFERKEVKDIVAYLKAALNPDDWESIKRVINFPARGIGKVTLAKMAAGQEDSLPTKTREKIANFRQLLQAIAEAAKNKKPSELIKLIVETSGIELELKQSGEEGIERLENVKEFASLATKYDPPAGGPSEDGVLALITETALVSDQDEISAEKKGVRLMTVHASKGLEFDYVFVSGLEQDLFPHAGLASSDERRDNEEERRLFYVALTRAREKLFLTYAQTRLIFGSRQLNSPSEFIFDISEDLIESDSDNLASTNYIDF
jgi:DNA helicase II / ATP-dependent DNA helicase PcrA